MVKISWELLPQLRVTFSKYIAHIPISDMETVRSLRKRRRNRIKSDSEDEAVNMVISSPASVHVVSPTRHRGSPVHTLKRSKGGLAIPPAIDISAVIPVREPRQQTGPCCSPPLRACQRRWLHLFLVDDI